MAQALPFTIFYLQFTIRKTKKKNSAPEYGLQHPRNDNR